MHLRTYITFLLLPCWLLGPPCQALAAVDWTGGTDWYSQEDCCADDFVPVVQPQSIPELVDRGVRIMQQKLSGEPEGFDLSAEFDRLEPPHRDGLLGRYSTLGEDSLYFLVPALTLMGVIYVLPESVSNWDKEDITIGNGWENWKYNVTTWVWDRDDAWINYIGHPYFGSTYFVYARHYGYSRLESLLFSFSISTFYEMGIEAWAEPVSIQDLIVTPLFGWGVAEVLLPLEHRIRKNGDTVLGSRMLGAVSLFLIDPFGHIVPPLKHLAREYLSPEAEVGIAPLVALGPAPQPAGQGGGGGEKISREHAYGLRFTVTW